LPHAALAVAGHAVDFGGGLAIFASLGIHAGYVLQDPGFDLTRFAIRSVYLVVAAVMLGYLGAYEGEVRHALAVQVERSKAMDERLQLACNLHDWLLQSLAGTALQIEAARRQIETDTEAADKSLLDVERLLAAEQRALRSLIRRLQPDRPEAPRPAPGLAVALQELADRIEMQWGLRITFDIAGLGDGLPERLEEAVCSLVGEALVNAARHGHAVRARVRIRLETEGMHVIVADDGRGYPLRGSYDLRSLTEQGLGPRSLLDRVAALEGELLLRTSDSGTRIEIVLPPGSGARPEGVPGPSAADKNG
ncbi:MAG: sensor histidine kinase, partial [Gammaproteobacteria bacterium]